MRPLLVVRACTQVALLAALAAFGTLAAGCASGPYQPEATWRARVEALTQAWPVGHYTVLAGGRDVGTMTLRQSVVWRDGEPVLLIEDAARITAPDVAGSGDYTYIVHCRLDDHFTPLDVETQAPAEEGEGGALFSRLDLAQGRLRGTAFGATLDVPVPQRVALRQGLMRLVGLLPRTPGGDVRLAFLSLSTRPRIDVERPVRCAGLDAVQIAGQPRPCWRFEYDSGPDGQTHVVSLWVAEDGRLLRFHDEQGLQLLATDA